MHMFSRKDLNKAELETREDIEKSDDGGDANGEVPAKEDTSESLDLLVAVMLLEETPAVLHLENYAKNLGLVTIGPEARNHTSSKKARKFIAKHLIMYHSSFLVYQRVPPPHLHLHRRKL